jgi:hypothetical protein
VRNFRRDVQEHHIEIRTPPGLVAEPAFLQGKISGESQEEFPVRLKADGNASAGVSIIAIDVTLDGRSYGQWFDFIVEVE